MKGGDLSNRHAPVIAFRHTCFIDYKQEEVQFSFWDKLRAIFTFERPFVEKWVLNHSNIQFLRYLWRNRDYTIHIYFLGPDYLVPELEEKLDEFGIPYSRVYQVDDLLALRTALVNNYTMYYVTSEIDEVSVVSSHKVKAVLFDDARKLL